MFEDADVCITKCVSLIGVIIHSIVFHLKYSIILNSDINKQVNAAIDASCSDQVAVSATLPAAAAAHFTWPNVKLVLGNFLSSIDSSLILINSEHRNLHSVRLSSKFLTQLNFYNFKHEM